MTDPLVPVPSRPVPAGGIVALTLTQPWAQLLALGAKRLETRSWGTNYRGPIAIHAAKTFPWEAAQLCREEPFKEVLAAAGFAPPGDLPRGAVIAIGRLVDVQQVGKRTVLPPVDSLEWDFGDLGAGRFLWAFADVERLPTPIPARGALGLWDWAGPP